MPTIPSYPAQTVPNNSDQLVIQDGVAAITKNITRTAFLAGAPLPSNTVTTAAITDSSVTVSKLAVNPYRFSVYRNASLNTANNTSAKVAFDTEDYDANNNFDSSTNYRYTAPITGTYHFDAGASISFGGAATAYVSLYKNGVEFVRGNQVSVTVSGAPLVTVSSDLQLTAADYVEVWVFSSATSGFNTGSTPRFVRFSGFLITKT